MEGFTIVLIFLVFVFLGKILRSAGAAARAATSAMAGKGTLSENLELQFKGMGPFAIKVVPGKFDLSGRLVDTLEVKVRGLLNAPRADKLVFATSLFDWTDGKWAPVLSSVDSFQERGTRAYQCLMHGGDVAPNQGFMSWVKIATIFPEILTGEYSGTRKLRVFVRGLPIGQEIFIERGFIEKDKEVFCHRFADCDVVLTEKGYCEAAQERRQAKVLSVQIAVGVAMADGAMAPEAGRVIQKWMKRELDQEDEGARLTSKQMLNDALREAYAANGGDIFGLDTFVSQMKRVGSKAQNILLLELCVDVMGARGNLDEVALRLVRKIASGLGVDYAELQAMSDRKLVQLETVPASEASIEALLGIESTWDADAIKNHLRSQFLKWNGRLQTLKEGTEKEQAQRMLDAIAKARTKYQSA